MSQRATELAGRLEKAVADFAAAVDGCSESQWAATCNAEGWSVAQTAQHVSGQFPLEMEFIKAAAEGTAMPSYTWDDINGKNDTRAAKNTAATKAGVVKELRESAASTAAYIRALSDEQLDRTGVLGLADGASVSAEQLITGGVLIEHVTGHLESIRNAK